MPSFEKSLLKNIEKNKQLAEKSVKEQPSELLPEVKEYNAEEGITRAVSEIERLLESQKYVVIAVCGSSIDVGTTYVSSAIGREISGRMIPCCVLSRISSLTLSGKPFFGETKTKGRVLMFTAESPAALAGEVVRQAQDDELKEQIKKEKLKIPVSKIDIRVFVYRPDRPFPPRYRDFRESDILIRNDEAIDDTGKIKE